MTSPGTCLHTQFQATLQVERTVVLTVPNWKAQLTMACSQCGTPFKFKGLPALITGILASPGASTDGKRIYAPIEPVP